MPKAASGSIEGDGYYILDELYLSLLGKIK
jgi:hypothetical protein